MGRAATWKINDESTTVAFAAHANLNDKPQPGGVAMFLHRTIRRVMIVRCLQLYHGRCWKSNFSFSNKLVQPANKCHENNCSGSTSRFSTYT